MDPARRDRIESIFEAAIELPSAARDAFVVETCGEDEALAAAVVALLRAHERAGGVLEGGPRASAAELLDAVTSGGGGAGGRAATGHERVGPYRIIDVLGRGGMGVVYLAERADGQFRQRVAVKVIRSDGDPDLAARMVAERQILATLDHPNIAKLLDGGVMEDGRPYLVMEYVAGLPIDTYCDRMRLTVAERLRLFATVARAVEHAHRNLVVHRDLKPSNILVSPDGRPKLLDFGIAKLLNPILSGVDSPATRTDRRVLTPEYASPEQLRGEALTTSSDVYALGVVLYRLLTGQAPYRANARSASAVLSAMLEEDPDRPSSRVMRREEREGPDGSALPIEPSQIARDRHTTPERLRRRLRGDLDAIVLKALRKEPPARYGSAELLAQDIDAFLRGAPVLAHRGSRWYRSRKLVQRHKASAVAATVVAISLLLGAGTATWQAGVAGRERDRANDALGQAERSARASEEVADFLMELFRSGDPDDGGGEVTARDLLRRGLDRADALAAEPVVQARMLDVLGQMHMRLGELNEAERLLSRAVALRREHLGARHPDVAESLIHLSWIDRSRARTRDAERLVQEALEIRRAAHGPAHPSVADAMRELGWLHGGASQEALYREALAIYEAANADPESQVGLLQGLSTNLRRQGRLEEAVESDRQALAVAEAAFGPDDAVTGYAMIHLADHVRDIEKDHAEAERLYLRGLELMRRTYGPRSTHLTHGYHSLASMYSRDGRHAEAERIAREMVSIRELATGPDHPSLAGEWDALAGILRRAGKLDEAEALSRRAIEHWRRTMGPRHPVVAGSMGGLALVHQEQGRFRDAEAVYDTILALHGEDGARQLPVGEVQRLIGRMRIRYGNLEGAEHALLESLEVMHAVYPDTSHPNVVDTKRALMELYAAWNRPELVERYRVPPGRFVAY